jgi:cytochrome d ubiquinol oxidase subunit I
MLGGTYPNRQEVQVNDPVVLSRIQFAFTVTYHYLFPQLTMGLAFLIAVLKTQAIMRRSDLHNEAVRFWSRIFAVSFIMGVVTGIPMEFAFGTNWARFSEQTGSIIAQMLAMEGAFAFFLESAFVGLLLFGERRFGQRVHWVASLLVWVGTWASGYFIIATDAWMQHPVGYTPGSDGTYLISDYWAILFNPWIRAQYTHTMTGAVITGCFVMAGLGAYYLLAEDHLEHARLFVRTGVVIGFVASLVQLWPTGDAEGVQVTQSQPVKLAAMEGLFQTTPGAGIVIIGQPNVQTQTIDNAIEVPRVLSFLTYQAWTAQVAGLDAFPADEWPDTIPLLYYAYHIMVGLGTMFIAIMGICALLLWRRQLFRQRWALWMLLLATPLPFVANTAGWMTAELGRQPWLAYALIRTSDGTSPLVSSGNILFTTLGFAGMYTLLSLLYVVVLAKEVAQGPEAGASFRDLAPAPAA